MPPRYVNMMGPRVDPSDIRGITPFSEAWLVGTDNAAEGRSTLGIEDTTEFRSVALARAHALVAFDPLKTPGVVYDSFRTLPGGGVSQFIGGASHAGGTFAIGGTGYKNGVLRAVTGADAAGYTQWGMQPIAGSFGYGSMDDLVAASSKWYMRMRFKMATAPLATGRSITGFTNLNGAAYLGLGYRGATSTAKFAASTYAGGVALSTVDIDTNWHEGEMWHDGSVLAGTIYFSFDSETAIPWVVAWGQVAGEFSYSDNNGTATSQEFDFDEVCYVTEGN